MKEIRTPAMATKQLPNVFLVLLQQLVHLYHSLPYNIQYLACIFKMDKKIEEQIQFESLPFPKKGEH